MPFFYVFFNSSNLSKTSSFDILSFNDIYTSLFWYFTDVETDNISFSSLINNNSLYSSDISFMSFISIVIRLLIRVQKLLCWFDDCLGTKINLLLFAKCFFNIFSV